MKKRRIGIVASRFNERYVDGLVNSALTVLEGHEVTVVRVPGAYEIPLFVQRLLKKKVEGVLALGLIWEGETKHADLIATTVSDALMRLMLDHDKPVLNQVLLVADEKQARARCLQKRLNRGREGAEALLEVLHG